MRIHPQMRGKPVPRRRFQFRLRSLMIAVLLAVVALAFILPAFQHARESGPPRPKATAGGHR